MNGEALRLRDRIIEECQQAMNGNKNERSTPQNFTDQQQHRIPATGHLSNGYYGTPGSPAYQIPVIKESPYQTHHSAENGYQSINGDHSDNSYQSLRHHGDALADSHNNNYKVDTSHVGYTPAKPPDIVPQYCEMSDSDMRLENNLHTNNTHAHINSDPHATHVDGQSSGDGQNGTPSAQSEKDKSADKKNKSNKSKISRLYAGKSSKKSEETSF